jgi:two-component system chemotaxis response regulator CheY
MTPDRLLLVTEIPDHLKSYTAALTSSGCLVQTACDGATALNLLMREVFDLAVIDIRLPDMTGWDLCRAIKAEKRLRAMPLIILTPDISTAHATASASAGCNAWLARPTVAEDLVRTIRLVLEQQKDAPGSPDEALLNELACPACASIQVRATLRMTPIQYYCCRTCGLCWRVEVL